MLMVGIRDSYWRDAVRRSLLIGVATLLLLGLQAGVLGGVLGSHALAAGPTCTITDLTPHSAPTGTDTGFAFTLTSPGDQIAWVKVTSPSAQVAIDGGSSDWLPTISYDTTQATFTGGPIDPGNPISVNVVASVSYFTGGNWTVQASSNSGGSSPSVCTGDTSLTVTDNNPPTFVSISASALTTSATIHWSTDKPTTGVADYGLTSGYGLSKSDATVGTTGSVNITGLKSGTVYHYQVTATDQSSNSVISNDSTFTTANPASEPPPTGGTGGSGGSGGVINTPVTDTTDKTPPKITIVPPATKILMVIPTITGEASDNVGVLRVEYSVDGGQNWLPADTTDGLGGKHVTFSFTPVNLDDGTYSLVARAVDAGGNITKTTKSSIVIDLLPPVVGGNVISVGPQVILPGDNEIIEVPANVDLTINLSTSGGATSVNLSAMDVTGSNSSLASNFSLSRLPDSGLWSGVLSFSEPGYYQLVAHAVDGANNKTTRVIDSIHVTRPGLVVSAKGPVAGAEVTIYYLDPDTNSWIIWDGEAYGQTNPQRAGDNGNFNSLLPPGTYYATVTAAGYATLQSSIITITRPSPLTANLRLHATSGLSFISGLLSSFSVQHITLQDDQSKVPSVLKSQDVTGQTLASFALTDTTGSDQNSVSWLGKPTVVTVMSAWAPGTAEQMAALEQVAANHDVNVKTIGLQNDSLLLQAYDEIGGSSLVWLADPDSHIVPLLKVGSMPTHYFVDRKGVIRAVAAGVLSPEQIIQRLADL